MGQGEAGRNQSLGVLKNMTEMLICILGGKGNHSKDAGEERGKAGRNCWAAEQMCFSES